MACCCIQDVLVRCLRRLPRRLGGASEALLRRGTPPPLSLWCLLSRALLLAVGWAVRSFGSSSGCTTRTKISVRRSSLLCRRDECFRWLAAHSILSYVPLRVCARSSEPREAWRVTYVTNRNASVLLIPVAIYVGLGEPELSGSPFMLRGEGCLFVRMPLMK